MINSHEQEISANAQHDEQAQETIVLGDADSDDADISDAGIATAHDKQIQHPEHEHQH